MSEWTKEQEEVIGKIIKESENIGYVQGYDDAIKEVLKDFEMMIFEIKKKIFLKKDE
jgi:hypothetical protein